MEKKGRSEERYENRRSPRPHTPYTLHALSLGETCKVRQRGMLSKALQERDDHVPKEKKKKQGIIRNETN